MSSSNPSGESRDVESRVLDAISPVQATVSSTYSSVTVNDVFFPERSPEAISEFLNSVVKPVETSDRGFMSVKVFVDLGDYTGGDVDPEIDEMDKGQPYTPSTLNVPEEQVRDDPVLQAVDACGDEVVLLSTWVKNPESVITDRDLDDYSVRAIVLVLTERAAGHPANQ